MLTDNQQNCLIYPSRIAMILLTIAMLALPGVAFPQTQQLTVATDKPSYSVGDTIKIIGTIPIVQEPTPIIVQIFNPENTVVATETPVPNSDGTYSIESTLAGPSAISGVYTVHVTYAEEDQETTFQFSGEDMQPKKDNLVITFSGGNSRTIDVKLGNGFISQITAIEESATLLFLLDTGSDDGELTIVLPREMIDSKDEPDETGAQEDNNFMVLVDGDYAEYSESASTPTDRTLNILIPAGTEEVLIGGSSIMPEFSVLATMVLAGATTIVVLVSRNSQILKGKY